MGKSTAAYGILRLLRNLVIIDFAHKHQFDLLGVVGEDPDLILHHPIVIWQPPRAAVTNPSKDFSDPWSRGLMYINTVRARSGVTVFHDEPRRTLPTDPHPYAAEMVDMGAGRGVSVWAAPQGFSRIYPPMFDNATHFFMFRIASASQRGSLAASLDFDPESLNLGSLQPHWFHYWRQGQLAPSGPHPLSVLGPRPPRG